MTPHDVLRMLYKDSGLLGLSGETGDMGDLLASDRPEAAQAIDDCVFRVRRETGAFSAVLGRIDGVVFCGAIGENAAPIRKRIREGMDYPGTGIDAACNQTNDRDKWSGRTRVMDIPTEEECLFDTLIAASRNRGEKPVARFG